MFSLSRKCGRFPFTQVRAFSTSHQTSSCAFLYERTNIVSYPFSFLNAIFGKTYLEGYIPHAGIVLSKQKPKRWSFRKEEPEPYQFSIKTGFGLTIYPHTMIHLNKDCEINLLATVELTDGQKRDIDLAIEGLKRVQNSVLSFEQSSGLSVSKVAQKDSEISKLCSDVWEQLTTQSHIREVCS